MSVIGTLLRRISGIFSQQPVEAYNVGRTVQFRSKSADSYVQWLCAKITAHAKSVRTELRSHSPQKYDFVRAMAIAIKSFALEGQLKLIARAWAHIEKNSANIISLADQCTINEQIRPTNNRLIQKKIDSINASTVHIQALLKRQ